MWPFLFVLAIVPMVFYWSDSVTDVFPVLAKYLPEKKAAPLVGPNGEPIDEAAQAAAAKTQWVELKNESGYVAYAISPDGQYRIAVGCHQEQPAALQVTHISGAPVSDELRVNYVYGELPLDGGAYAGDELVGAVAQFNDVYVQNDDNAVVTRFNVSKLESGGIARNVQSTCTQ